MYGPPPDCKWFEVVRKNSPRKCIRPLSGELCLRALDDDPHVSVLINPSVTRDAFSPAGFRHVVGQFFRLLLSSADLGKQIAHASPSWRWESGKRFVASASMKSFLFDLRYGLTNCAGISRTSCPCWRSTVPKKCDPAHASKPINDAGKLAV